MAIGTRITELRGQESRRSFSKRIGIVENTLRNYEDGLSLPNSDTIATICKELGISAKWLVFGEGPIREGECSAPEAAGPAEDTAAYEARIAELERRLREREATINALTTVVNAAYGQGCLPMETTVAQEEAAPKYPAKPGTAPPNPSTSQTTDE